MNGRASVGRDILAVGRLRLLHARYELVWGAHVVPLTRQESILLACLLATPGRLVTMQVIRNALWSEGPSPPSNVLHVLVTRVRRRLAQLQYPGGIVSVHGRGYRFVAAHSKPDTLASLPPRSHRLSDGAILTVDPEQRTMRAGKRSVRLSPIEARVFTRLLQDTGRVVSFGTLFSRAGGTRPCPATICTSTLCASGGTCARLARPGTFAISLVVATS